MTRCVRNVRYNTAPVAIVKAAGITRFFDDTTPARRSANGDEAVQMRLEEMIWLTSPQASGDYRGASITRQLTYAIDSTPLDDLRGATVPLFVAGGTLDDKAPIEGADAFVAEILREKDRKISYLLLPGLDHGFVSKGGADHWNGARLVRGE